MVKKKRKPFIRLAVPPQRPTKKPVQESCETVDSNPFVYFIKSEFAVKIGVTKNLRTRLSSLQTATHLELEVHRTIHCDDAYQLEGALHQTFIDNHIRGEWFNLSILSIVDDLCSQYPELYPSATT